MFFHFLKIYLILDLDNVAHPPYKTPVNDDVATERIKWAPGWCKQSWSLSLRVQIPMMPQHPWLRAQEIISALSTTAMVANHGCLWAHAYGGGWTALSFECLPLTFESLKRYSWLHMTQGKPSPSLVGSCCVDEYWP